MVQSQNLKGAELETPHTCQGHIQSSTLLNITMGTDTTLGSTTSGECKRQQGASLGLGKFGDLSKESRGS